MTVYKKLLDIQAELKAPKNQRNNFGNYNYRSCEDILESVKPLLAKYKATLFISDSIEQVGTRIYIKATVTFVDIETGEKIENTALARESETKKGMDDSQITGSTSSYARKYALNGLFCIDDTKDSDATNTHGKENNGSNATTLSDKQVSRLIAIAKGVNVTLEQVKQVINKQYGITEIAKLTKTQYDEVCKRLESKKNNK